ncbi:MAG: DUF1697 domain-containing protein [Bacteroidetes bacterium]|nr:DUF1697 domain-containing protein [Bacteroidota bacterium]
METYIALLRGINVGGHNKMKMLELKQLFVDLGYLDVVSYIQSGNVIFNSKKLHTVEIEKSIIDAIEKQFAYSIKVLVLTKTELNTIFNSNPFILKHNLDVSKLSITLLNNKPELGEVVQIQNLVNSSDDTFEIINKSVYLYLPDGSRNTKLTNNLFEKKLKSSATSRNWRTITKLVELSTQQFES